MEIKQSGHLRQVDEIGSTAYLDLSGKKDPRMRDHLRYVPFTETLPLLYRLNFSTGHTVYRMDSVKWNNFFFF